MGRKELADNAGVGYHTVRRMEDEEGYAPGMKTVVRVAKALDVHPDELKRERDSQHALGDVRPFPDHLKNGSATRGSTHGHTRRAG